MTTSTTANRTDARRTAAVVLAGFCAFLDLYAPQPMLPMLARVFQHSAAGVSLLVSISTLAVAFTAPFAGLLADRLGRKQVIVPASLLIAVPTLLAATSASYGQLLFWRFWQGVFTPGIFAVTVAYINEEWEEGVGSAMAAYVSGTVLGGFCGRSLAALTAAWFSWRWAFVLLAVLNTAGALAIRAWLPAGRRFGPAAGAGGQLRTVITHMRNRRLLATYAAGFCVLFSMLGTFTYVNFYLSAPPFRLGTAALGLLFVVYLVGAVVTPVAGRFIDRMGHRAAFAGGLMVALAGTLATLVASLPMVILGLALSCTGVFIAQSAASTYIGTVAAEGRASAVGLYVTCYYLGGTFGSAVPGFLWSRGGWPACVMLIALVQLGTIAFAAAFWREPDGRGSMPPGV